MNKIIFFSVLTVILIIAWYFLWYVPSEVPPVSSSAGIKFCTTPDNKVGKIVNGTCIPFNVTPDTIGCGGIANPC